MRALHTATALAAVVCTAGLAACGGSGQSAATGTGGSAKGRPNMLAFSACMRANGLPHFPDPSPGGGIHISPAEGLNPFSPTFKAAQSACRKLLPGGGPGAHGTPSAQVMAQLLAVSRCMRSHGVAGFPDPTTTAPALGSRAYGLVVDEDGAVLALPRSVNPSSPAFQRAAAACHFGGPPRLHND